MSRAFQQMRSIGTIAAATAFLLVATPAAAYHGDFDLDTYDDGIEFYGGSDGTSAASTPESLTGDVFGFTAGSCSDALDNDGDGFVDGADIGCQNGDGDAVLGVPMDDQVELNLASNFANPASTPEHWFLDYASGGATTSCTNGVDDDADGNPDFTDYYCFIDVDLDGTPGFLGDTEGGCAVTNTNGLFGTSDCTDGEDNDGDGFTDGAEPSCVDNDGDGVSNTCDQEGPQGFGSVAGLGGTDDCFDGVDNDNNGATDYPADANCGTCFGLPPTITGTAGDDPLIGTPGDDVILALQGDDKIRGVDGVDYVCAGPGNDRVVGGNGNDIESGSDGDDKLVGSSDDDLLVGDNGNDKLIGSSGQDYLYAGPGDDKLVGSSGDDLLYGDVAIIGPVLPGNDTLVGGGGNDVLLAGPGNDSLKGSGGTDSCDGEDGTDTASASCDSISNVP